MPHEAMHTHTHTHKHSKIHRASCINNLFTNYNTGQILLQNHEVHILFFFDWFIILGFYFSTDNRPLSVFVFYYLHANQVHIRLYYKIQSDCIMRYSQTTFNHFACLWQFFVMLLTFYQNVFLSFKGNKNNHLFLSIHLICTFANIYHILKGRNLCTAWNDTRII